MKTIALVSGGKDSCYNMQLCVEHGHQIVALANLAPQPGAADELDSYMYQTVGHQLVTAYAQCMALPLFRCHTSGRSHSQGLAYSMTEGDEVEDLYRLLSHAKQAMPELQAVSSGAIASDYQRLRVEHVCARLGLSSLAYMWHQPQAQLLRGMIKADIQAILVKVAAMGLDPHKHLGCSLAQIEPVMHRLNRDFGCNICGEGGEYETLTLDCPLFTHGRILLEAWEVVEGSPDPFSPVGHLRPQRFHVQPKDIPPVTAGLHPHVQPKDPPGGTAGCRPPAALPGGAEQGPGAQLRSEPSAPGAQASSCESSPPGHTPAGSDTEIPQQQQQHEDQETAQQQNGHAGPGRVIQVPSLLPAASSAADRARQPGQPPPMAAEAVLSVSSHAVHAACSPRFASSAESEASQSAAATGQALSHALQVISKGLQDHGADLSRALFVHLHLRSMAHFPAANAAFASHFASVNPPARACVESLLPPGCPVAVGVLCRAAGENVPKVLHVQSISDWAPACIGPYAQAVASRQLLRMAGQIPLEPGSMQIEHHDLPCQLQRCWTSCLAVAVAMRCNLSHSLLHCTAYHTSQDADTISAFLQNPPRPTAGSDSPPEDSEAAEEGSEGPGAQMDAYLEAPLHPGRASWEPLRAVLAVSGLPRGALVELQPLACLADMPQASSSSGSEDEAGSKTNLGLRARKWPARLTNRRISWTAEQLADPAGSTAVLAPPAHADSAKPLQFTGHMLAAPGQFLLLQLSVLVPQTGAAEAVLETAFACIGAAAAQCLADAKLRTKHIVCTCLYALPGLSLKGPLSVHDVPVQPQVVHVLAIRDTVGHDCMLMCELTAES